MGVCFVVLLCFVLFFHFPLTRSNGHGRWLALPDFSLSCLTSFANYDMNALLCQSLVYPRQPLDCLQAEVTHF